MRLDELVKVFDENLFIRIYDKNKYSNYIYFGKVKDLEGDVEDYEVDRIAPSEKDIEIWVHEYKTTQ